MSQMSSQKEGIMRQERKDDAEKTMQAAYLFGKEELTALPGTSPE